VRNVASFSTPLANNNFELLAFENAASYPNFETNFVIALYILSKFGKVGSTHP